MKNLIFYCLYILILSLCYSEKSTAQQVYTIPWAVQQPQWVFPIWFEDATGAKDTIYFGIDATSTNVTDLGYRHYSVDTSVFHVYSIFGWLDTCKVIIGDYSIGGQILSTSHVQYPLILRWDKSLLFTEPNPSWNFDNNSRLESTYIFFNYLQTNPPYNSVHLKEIDSLYLPGESSQGIDTNFPLDVYLTTVFGSSINESNVKRRFKVLNNPTDDEIFVSGDVLFNWEIYDLQMQFVKSEKEWTYNKSISLRTFPKGIYYLFINTSAQKYYEKIIKN